MSGKGCPRCSVVRDDKGREHHAPGCPELRWPDGHLRGTIHPEALRPLRSCDPSRIFPLHSQSPLSEEMAAIFKTTSEEAPLADELPA